jgi:hypothetical protein
LWHTYRLPAFLEVETWSGGGAKESQP